jgi:hypothetical protein
LAAKFTMSVGMMIVALVKTSLIFCGAVYSFVVHFGQRSLCYERPGSCLAIAFQQALTGQLRSNVLGFSMSLFSQALPRGCFFSLQAMD